MVTAILPLILAVMTFGGLDPGIYAVYENGDYVGKTVVNMRGNTTIQLKMIHDADPYVADLEPATGTPPRRPHPPMKIDYPEEYPVKEEE